MSILILLSFLWAQEIQVKEISYTDKKSISLGDISISQEISESLKEELEKIVLVEDLSKGSFRSFTKKYLVELYRNLLKSYPDIKLKLPQVAYVSRVEAQWNRASIESYLKDELRKECRNCDIEISVDLLPEIENVLSWKAQVNYNIRNQRTYVPIQVRYVEEEKVLSKSIQLGAEWFFYKEVPVAVRNLPSEHRLVAEDLETRRILLPRRGNFFTLVDSVVGKKTKRVLPQGKLISFLDLEKSFDVLRGQKVKAYMISNNIQIRLDAIAKENASIGDEIKIENPINRSILHAIVVDASTVEVR